MSASRTLDNLKAGIPLTVLRDRTSMCGRLGLPPKFEDGRPIGMNDTIARERLPEALNLPGVPGGWTVAEHVKL